MTSSLPVARTWCLERDDRRTRFASIPGLVAYGESRGAQTGEHRCPAWKLVVPVGGARVRPGRATVIDVGHGAVVVPALQTHVCGVDGPFLCVLADRWMWPEPTGPVACPVGSPGLSAVLAAARRWVAGDGGWEELGGALVGWNGAVGPRGPVARALEEMRRTDDLGTPARELGQSASHARRRVLREVGCTPGVVRRWMRLARGYAAVGERAVVAASAEAGFADQAHFTRTSTSMAGRTPGSVRRS